MGILDPKNTTERGKRVSLMLALDTWKTDTDVTYERLLLSRYVLLFNSAILKYRTDNYEIVVNPQ